MSDRQALLPPKLRKILPKLPALLIAAGIWVLSSKSILPQPKGILGWDKFQHLLAYAVLALAAGLWPTRAFWSRRPALAFFATALAAALYGAIDETHQYFVPGRDCNVWDWLADTLGALLGAGAIFAASRLCKARQKNDRHKP